MFKCHNCGERPEWIIEGYVDDDGTLRLVIECGNCAARLSGDVDLGNFEELPPMEEF